MSQTYGIEFVGFETHNLRKHKHTHTHTRKHQRIDENSQREIENPDANSIDHHPPTHSSKFSSFMKILERRIILQQELQVLSSEVALQSAWKLRVVVMVL
jgi:hypothetical protein